MFVFQELTSLPHHFSAEVESSSKGAESGFLSVKSGLKNVETGLKSMDSKADVGETFSLETAVESLITADTPAAKDKFTAAYTLEQHETLHISDLHTKSLQAEAALEATRLIPARPITPFAVSTSVEFVEGGDEDQCLSTAPHKVPVSERKKTEFSNKC